MNSSHPTWGDLSQNGYGHPALIYILTEFTRYPVTRWLRVVIDSGCTWHVHNRLDDLVNTLPCSDIIVDANGHQVTCAFKGDLPLLAQDAKGKEFQIVLRGVRYSHRIALQMGRANRLGSRG